MNWQQTLVNMAEIKVLQNWQGRVDYEDGNDGLRLHQVIQAYRDETVEPGITFIGLTSDLGVQHNQGRAGAAQGPIALRKAMSNMAWHFKSPVFEAGDVVAQQNPEDDAKQAQPSGPLAAQQKLFADRVAGALAAKQFVVGLGGGHEIAWASYQGCRQHLDQQTKRGASIGIINFDAHFDLRKPARNSNGAGNSGTPFYQISQDCLQRGQPFHYCCLGINEAANTKALFDYAHAQKVNYLLDTQCVPTRSAALIEEFVAGIDYLYLTFCLDALPASVAPGVSAPSALGIELAFALTALKQIHQACKKHQVEWLMADIAELNPLFDIDARTARVAARLAYEIIKLSQH